MNPCPRLLAALILCLPLVQRAHAQDADAPRPLAVRFATFNVEDLRTTDLTPEPSERARRIAEVIARVRPSVLLVNEIAYDEPGSPGYVEGQQRGQNGQRLANLLRDRFGVRYNVFMARSNTGLASGFDLDRDGAIHTNLPDLDDRAAARAYGGDAWGFGTFPGQYAMALLVDERLEILTDDIRTFRLLPWSYMPNALLPTVPAESAEGDANADSDTDAEGNPESDPQPWYAGEAGERFRLSSKSHWDVPVRLPNGAIVHLLCSHPTPPAFDGPERRNKKRNHDEIRFWADYLAGAAYIVDDAGTPGGLAPGASFVILGDLNADPDEGSSIHDPIGLLLDSPRVARNPAPTADAISDLPADQQADGLDPDDTARFRLRVDYALLSAELEHLRSGVWRHPPEGGDFPSDHFPVWVDAVVPPPG